MRSAIAVSLLFCLPALAQQDRVTAGASTPAEAFSRLQAAAKARDLGAMVAVLDPEYRAGLLAVMSAVTVGLLSGEDGAKANTEAAEKLLGKLALVIGPVIEANPIDAQKLAALSESERNIYMIGYGMSKLPVEDAIRLAVAVDAELSKIEHPSKAKMWDGFTRQIPVGTLKLTRENGRAASATAGGKPISFVRIGDRWYATSVWELNKPAPAVVAEEAPKNEAITAQEAITRLRLLVSGNHPNARLYKLEIEGATLNADGTSTGWVGYFLTDKPGESVFARLLSGGINVVAEGTAPADAKPLPEDSEISFDSQRLYALAKGSNVVATLQRNASGGAVWVLHGDGGDVIVDAKTFKTTTR